ncbi:hypothetical protein FA15DRAFT_696866 [Coprinopsis marcescibilis]|uniref:DUF6533 domain-containing protein n=1 Tax=Coprinopsis marcescibilis TaxID=230819 RepID=A0A5C3KJQ7_COPMA|nr:hypothetical protein FA15DRAFT_696866 [Coprinopsis marcescibilis]
MSTESFGDAPPDEQIISIRNNVLKLRALLSSYVRPLQDLQRKALNGLWEIAEYFETIELEVSLIWPVSWNLMKMLYFINRLLPPAVLPFMIAYNFTATVTHSYCKVIFTIPCLGVVAGILFSEAILYIRVLALSGKSRRMLIFVIANGTVVSVTSFALMARYIMFSSWGPSKYSIPGCYGRLYDGILVTMAYSLALYSGVVVALLCIYFGVKVYWSSCPGPIVRIFYLDGMVYFIALALLSVGNGLGALFMPAPYRFIMAPIQVVADSSISTRMILHIKDSARKEIGLSTAPLNIPAMVKWMLNLGSSLPEGTKSSSDSMQRIKRYARKLQRILQGHIPQDVQALDR